MFQINFLRILAKFYLRALWQANANAVYTELSTVPGLNPVMPAGAMYMMVGIDLQHYPVLTSAVDFIEKLMSEQSVFCLPGEVWMHTASMHSLVLAWHLCHSIIIIAWPDIYVLT